MYSDALTGMTLVEAESSTGGASNISSVVDKVRTELPGVVTTEIDKEKHNSCVEKSSEKKYLGSLDDPGLLSGDAGGGSESGAGIWRWRC